MLDPKTSVGDLIFSNVLNLQNNVFVYIVLQ